MSQYLDKDGASRIAENFLLKQSEQDAILENLRFDLKEAEHALVKTIQGPAPLNIRALTRPLDDYRISGNTVQNGTPAPDAPVDVVGCGVRTENLVEFFDTTITVFNVNIKVEKQNVTFSGTASGNGGRLFPISKDIVLEPGVYSFETLGGGQRPSAILQSKTNSSKYYFSGTTITLESNETFFISFLFNAGREYNGNLKAMLNTGSTPLPYEPYGYKLPLTVNGTEYPIYLGEVQSTRKIKKLVLTGEERWTLWQSGQPDVERYYYKWGKTTPTDYNLICTHFRFTNGDGNFEHIRLGGNIRDDMVIFISKTIAPTVADFKSYLAAQYANGNPVTIWYTITEPETAVVNEPLMKIGNYADTISYAQSDVEISTTKGFNTITTDTAVLPSNIEVKGVINNA